MENNDCLKWKIEAIAVAYAVRYCSVNFDLSYFDELSNSASIYRRTVFLKVKSSKRKINDRIAACKLHRMNTNEVFGQSQTLVWNFVFTFLDMKDFCSFL